MKIRSQMNYALLAGASATALMMSAPVAIAQEDDGARRTLDTVIVTTQKTEESIQDVPIAVSAFDPANLDRLNINTGQDLQFNIPNFQASQGNFSAGSISIRGIRNAAVGASSDAAVGTHVNNVPAAGSFALETEFYDVERVEILRGPQGTLYGRNATGGVLNVITAKPELEEFNGSFDVTLGEYNNQKFSGHLNLPIGDNLGLRLAGFSLKRDGYSDALLSDGSVEDVDGRDLYAIRATLGGEITEKASFWIMAEHYEEDSSRTRSTKQLCTKDTRPFPFNQGCVPYQLDGLGYARDGNGNPIEIYPEFGTVNSIATLGGVLGASAGVLSPAFNGDVNAGATTSTNLREFETNLVPEFDAETNFYQAEFQYEFDNNTKLTVLASTADRSRIFTDDYNKGNPTVDFLDSPLTPGGVYPGPAAFGLSIPVETNLRTPATSLYATDRSSSEFDTDTIEVRLQSDFDGAFNYNIGALQLSSEGETNYNVFFNTAEIVAIGTNLGAGGAEVLPGDRTYFLSRSPYKLDAFGAFGEMYYQANDDLKWTLGLRYTKDEKEQLNTPSLLLAPALGPTAVAPGVENGQFEGGPVQEADFEEVTGRVGFDLQLGEFGPTVDTMVYGSLARGYKGGGINPPQSAGLEGVGNTFDPEFINSIEFGSKSTILGGAGILNMSAFYYDYEGYQISSIVNRTSVNQNVDAEVMGFEAELYMQLTENFRVDAALGLLDATLSDQAPLLDTYDQTGGNADYIVVKNPATTQNCIALVSEVNALLASPAAAAAALICSGGAPGVTPLEGIAVDVSGNKMPTSPDTTFSIGAEYEWDMSDAWAASLRGDFYYQSEMFTRIFNMEADKIDSWQNLNVSFTMRNDDKGLELELYGKNLAEDDQVTNQYLTDASSGLYTNVFLLEPRQFGIRVSKDF
ncbi:MAG: TonB-dependent receptor [Henriciella sp.]